MPKYEITGVYEYSGEVEADTEAEALKLFYKDLNSYYYGAVSEDVELVEDEEGDE
jgi:hypothetical protein